MNTLRKYVYTLLSLFFILTACNNNDENVSGNITEEYDAFVQLKRDDSLLKKMQQEGEFYIFQFETDTLTIPVDDVLSIETDLEHWNTILTLQNQSSINIPTLGTSMQRS